MIRFNPTPFNLPLFLFGLCLLLTACGGAGTSTNASSSSASASSSSTSAKPGGIAGIDGTGTELPGDVTSVTSIGAISNNTDGFNLNGTTYDISQSAIIIDGTLSDSAVLSSGQVVSVRSSQDTTTHSLRLAESIEAVSLVRGKVNEDENSQLSILKQNITVDESTLLGNGLSLDSNLAGLDLQVSGYRLADGSISATLIEQSSLDQQIVGNISSLERINGQLFINSLAINVSGVSLSDSIINGSTVLVKGRAFDTQGRLVAETIINLEDTSEESDLVEIEGFITSENGLFEFSIGNDDFVLNSSTVYVGGDLKSIATDKKVRVFTKARIDETPIVEKLVFLQSSLLNFKTGDTLNGTKALFQWSDVSADEYKLEIRTVYGERKTLFQEYFSPEILETTVSQLPQNGSSIDIILSTRTDQNWHSKNYRINAVLSIDNAELEEPSVNELLSGKSQRFSWTDVGADEYQLMIYNSTVIFDQKTTQTSLLVENLPVNSAILDVYLLTRHDEFWHRKKYSIRSANLIENSTLISHINQSKLSSDTETFIWNDTGASKYRLQIYPTIDRREIFDQEFDSETLSATVSGLPKTNAEAVIKLYSYHDGWGFNTYTREGSGEISNSKITSHKNGDLIMPNDTLSWTVPDGTEAVNLKVNSVNINKNILHHKTYSPETSSVLVEGLPRNGALVDITISSLHNGWWTQDYIRLSSYSEYGTLDVTSHAEGGTITKDNPVLMWTDLNADAYRIYIGSNQYNFNGDTTSLNISELNETNGQKMIRVLANHDGWWKELRYPITIEVF